MFASAAGQFFLTLLPSQFNIEDKRFSTKSESLLKVGKRKLWSDMILIYFQHFNDPALIYEKGRIDGMLKFLLNAPIEKPGLHSSPLLRTAFQKSELVLKK